MFRIQTSCTSYIIFLAFNNNNVTVNLPPVTFCGGTISVAIEILFVSEIKIKMYHNNQKNSNTEYDFLEND